MCNIGINRYFEKSEKLISIDPLCIKKNVCINPDKCRRVKVTAEFIKQLPKGRISMSKPSKRVVNTVFTDHLFNDNAIVKRIRDESDSQIAKWGIQTHSIFEWLTFTTEELGELSEAISEYVYRGGNPEEIEKEAIQVATLAMKIASMANLEVVINKLPSKRKVGRE